MSGARNGSGLPTPPSSALPSPTSPAGDGSGDTINNFEHDLEKQALDEKEKFQDMKYAEGVRSKSLAMSGTTKVESTPTQSWGGLFGKLICKKDTPDISRQEDDVSETRPVETIDDHPKGYPQFAAFLDSDENFLIYRKYGFLRNRVLLYRQDELAEMEQNLMSMDEDDSSSDPDRLKCRQIDEEMDREHKGDPIHTRKGLIQAIDNKLKEYDNALQRLHFFSGLRAPSARNATSLTKWNNWNQPLKTGDAAFLSHRSDLVSVSAPTESGRLDGFIEDCLMTVLPRRLIRRCLTSDEQKLKSRDDYMQLVSKKRIEILARLVLTAAVVGLLVGPSAVLFLWEGHAGAKVGLICVFTFLFASAIGICTKAKRQEMLAATAT